MKRGAAVIQNPPGHARGSGGPVWRGFADRNVGGMTRITFSATTMEFLAGRLRVILSFWGSGGKERLSGCISCNCICARLRGKKDSGGRISGKSFEMRPTWEAICIRFIPLSAEPAKRAKSYSGSNPCWATRNPHGETPEGSVWPSRQFTGVFRSSLKSTVSSDGCQFPDDRFVKLIEGSVWEGLADGFFRKVGLKDFRHPNDRISDMVRMRQDSRGAPDREMGEVDRANSFAPVLKFLIEAVTQIFRRYRGPFRDDVGGPQILE
jgi:hypothetical protein